MCRRDSHTITEVGSRERVQDAPDAQRSSHLKADVPTTLGSNVFAGITRRHDFSSELNR